jgi:hypothetical protein
MVRTDWSAKVLFINTIIKGYTVKQAVSRGTLLRVRRGTVARSPGLIFGRPGSNPLDQPWINRCRKQTVLLSRKLKFSLATKAPNMNVVSEN